MSAAGSVAVTGASGHLSRRVLAYLSEICGDRHILAATRFPGRVSSLAEKGTEVRRLDFEDRASLGAAFSDVQQLLLVCPSRYRTLFFLRNHLCAAIRAAERAGVQRVVFVSSSHPEVGSPMILADIHCGIEYALASSSMGWVFLRMNLFTDLLWEMVICQSWTGSVVAAAGEGGAAFVTLEDAARTAAHALLRTGLEREVLEVTGPSTVTFTQVAEEVSQFAGQKISYVRSSPALSRQHLISSAGFSAFEAELLVSYQMAIQEGRYGPASTVVQNLTGTIPMSLSEYVSKRRRAWAQADTEAAPPPAWAPAQ